VPANSKTNDKTMYFFILTNIFQYKICCKDTNFSLYKRTYL